VQTDFGELPSALAEVRRSSKKALALAEFKEGKFRFSLLSHYPYFFPVFRGSTYSGVLIWQLPYQPIGNKPDIRERYFFRKWPD
jgi:hypothetical protein